MHTLRKYFIKGNISKLLFGNSRITNEDNNYMFDPKGQIIERGPDLRGHHIK